MPYYRWSGINLQGVVKTGTLFASSYDVLDALLLKRQIALLHAKKAITFFSWPISQVLIIQFFQELSLLLDSGILLPDALEILANQFSHPGLQEVVQDLANQVRRGIALYQAMSGYPKLFQDYMVHMVATGHESGKLAYALAMLAEHLQFLHTYRTTMRSAMLAPLITIGFFIVITVLIFTTVMPTFASMFASSGQQLPALTQTMLAISDWMRSGDCLMALVFVVGVILFFHFYKHTQQGRLMMDNMCLSLPLVAGFSRQNAVIQCLSSLSLAISCGVPLLKAIALSKNVLNNSILAQQIALVERDVQNGASLGQAMVTHADFIEQDVILMITVGQESGRLGVMLHRACVVYKNKVSSFLSRVSLLIQPTLMLCIGMLVALLIFAIYTPLFNLSQMPVM